MDYISRKVNAKVDWARSNGYFIKIYDDVYSPSDANDVLDRAARRYADKYPYNDIDDFFDNYVSYVKED